MREIVKKTTVYTFDELSEESKTKVANTFNNEDMCDLKIRPLLYKKALELGYSAPKIRYNFDNDFDFFYVAIDDYLNANSIKRILKRRVKNYKRYLEYVMLLETLKKRMKLTDEYLFGLEGHDLSCDINNTRELHANLITIREWKLCLNIINEIKIDYLYLSEKLKAMLVCSVKDEKKFENVSKICSEYNYEFYEDGTMYTGTSSKWEELSKEEIFFGKKEINPEE